MQQHQIQRFQKLIHTQLAEITSRHSKTEVAEGGLPADQLDQAALIEEQRSFQNQLKLEEVRKNLLKSALIRLDAGDFGCCTSCGDEIPEQRLLHLPHAERCIDCQTELERER